MQRIKLKLLLWYLLIQVVVLAGFNYALFINVERHLNEKKTTVLQTHEAIEHLINSFWIISPLILILSSLGGYFLLTKYFEPLKKMLFRIESIHADNLSGRIEVSKSDDEINGLALAFNAMLERLEKTFATMASFNTQSSHTLRTPLTIMRCSIEIILRKERSPEEYRRTLEEILEEILALQQHIESLLFIAEYDTMEVQHTLYALKKEEQGLLKLKRTLASNAG
jgi:two-component system heavy metal sensor histidine kinase CusS